MIAIPTLLGISLVCFVLIQLTPGGPVEQIVAEWKGQAFGEAGGGRRVEITEEQKQMLEKSRDLLVLEISESRNAKLNEVETEINDMLSV